MSRTLPPWRVPTCLRTEDAVVWLIGAACRVDVQVEGALRKLGELLAGSDRPDLPDAWEPMMTKLRTRAQTNLGPGHLAKVITALDEADTTHRKRNRLVHDDWRTAVVDPSGSPVIWGRPTRSKYNGHPMPGRDHLAIEDFETCVLELYIALDMVEAELASIADDFKNPSPDH